jgi:protein gp37
VSTATKIEWTEVTWNPTTGCDRISPGCDHCYALTLAKRLKAMGQAKYQHDGDPRTSGPGFGITMHEDALEQPLRWRTPRTVFVNSMSDIGHARVGRSFVARTWAVMALTQRHTFQVLTKRPKRLAVMLSAPGFANEVARYATDVIESRAWRRWQLDLGGQRLGGDSGLGGGWTTTWAGAGTKWSPPWPLPNVWVGTSIENDDYTWPAEFLRQVPASTRFLSLEPLLGPLPSLDLTGIDWVIVGGESGSDARPMEVQWVRDLLRSSAAPATCLAAGTGRRGDPKAPASSMRGSACPRAAGGSPRCSAGQRASGSAAAARPSQAAETGSKPGCGSTRPTPWSSTSLPSGRKPRSCTRQNCAPRSPAPPCRSQTCTAATHHLPQPRLRTITGVRPDRMPKRHSRPASASPPKQPPPQIHYLPSALTAQVFASNVGLRQRLPPGPKGQQAEQVQPLQPGHPTLAAHPGCQLPGGVVLRTAALPAAAISGRARSRAELDAPGVPPRRIRALGGTVRGGITMACRPAHVPG